MGKKKKKKISFTVPLPPAQGAVIDRMAAEEGIGRADVVTNLLDEILAIYEAEGPGGPRPVEDRAPIDPNLVRDLPYSIGDDPANDHRAEERRMDREVHDTWRFAAGRDDIDSLSGPYEPLRDIGSLGDPPGPAPIANWPLQEAEQTVHEPDPPSTADLDQRDRFEGLKHDPSHKSGECPIVCDDDCDADCHDLHNPRHKQNPAPIRDSDRPWLSATDSMKIIREHLATEAARQKAEAMEADHQADHPDGPDGSVPYADHPAGPRLRSRADPAPIRADVFALFHKLIDAAAAKPETRP